jgi:hypothetical protein
MSISLLSSSHYNSLEVVHYIYYFGSSHYAEDFSSWLLALNRILSSTHMSSVERIFDLPNGVSLDTTIVTPRSNVSSQQTQSQKLAVFCHPWSWLGGRKEDP